MKPKALIIGTGIAGASAAYHLSQSHSVTVIESEVNAGLHSTGRSAASLSTTSGLPEVCALAEASRDFLVRPPNEFTEIELTSPKGLLWIGRDSSDNVSLNELSSRNGEGIPRAQRIEPSQCKQILPELRDEAISAGGVWEPDCLSIDVAELLLGYIRSAKANGAYFHFDTSFISANQTGSSTWQVRTSQGQIEADILVNAAGAWSDSVAEKSGLHAIPLQPYRRTAALVKTPTFVSNWPLTMDIGSRVYFEPESGGLLFSLSEETPRPAEDCKPEEEDVALALDRLAECVDFQGRYVIQSWAGLRVFASDRLPVIGADPQSESFFWIAGQGGSGIKTAPAVAEVLCAVINDVPLSHYMRHLGISKTSFSPSRCNL